MASMAKRPFYANHAPFEDRQDDPLARILLPPADESPEQRAAREQQQREATRVSLEIDESLQEDRKAYERRKKAVKILLLGASPYSFPCTWACLSTSLLATYCTYTHTLHTHMQARPSRAKAQP